MSCPFHEPHRTSQNHTIIKSLMFEKTTKIYLLASLPTPYPHSQLEVNVEVVGYFTATFE